MTLAVVAGAIANKPRNGGEAWVRLSWVLGLQRLGFDVRLVEELDPATCVDERGRPAGLDASVQMAHWRAVVERFGLEGRAALIVGGGRHVEGSTWDRLHEEADEADLLVNISGALRDPGLRSRFDRAAYVDLDPGFTQFWAAQGADVGLDGHDLYFTVGLNVGTAVCDVPTGDVEWRPLPPFVVLDEWPVVDPASPSRLTTVASWRSYGRVEHGDRTFSLKAHQFRRFVELPQRAPQTFEIALDIHPGDDADRRLLEESGWVLVDPVIAAGDPDRFRSYVQGSGGEFSVAQGIYVETRSGWVSDRTVKYLASGLPALVQDTGIRDLLPTGEGLLTFSDLDEAVAGAHDIARDPDRHRLAARQLAQQQFDSAVVLGRLLAAAIA